MSQGSPGGERPSDGDRMHLILAVMSQEIRTFLNAVVGYTELLRTEIPGPLNDEQRDQLDRIHAMSDRLLVLLEELMAFSGLGEDEEQPAGTETGPA